MKRVLLILLIVITFIPLTLALEISFDDFESNSWNGGIGWSNSWTYTGGCAITTLNSPIGTYQVRGQTSCDLQRSFDSSNYQNVVISFYATASSLEGSESCEYYYFDGNSYQQMLRLVDGQDDGVLKYYTYNVIQTSPTAKVRMLVNGGNGDYCMLDHIYINGESLNPTLGLHTSLSYPPNSIISVEMTSSIPLSKHQLVGYDSLGLVFCNNTITSPSTPDTTFYTSCVTPSIQNNAYFTLSYENYSTTKSFNIVGLTNDDSKFKINRVYFSQQVLQGGSTEIYAIIDTNSTINNLYVLLTFPDYSTRRLDMITTSNKNEYKSFITDTYKVGNVSFEIRAESGIYYDSYINEYQVVAYNVDFVNTVNYVNKVLEAKMQVFGTEYRVGDKSTIFLQLKDINGLPENEALCYLDIFYPNIPNQTHPVMLSKAPMLHKEGSDGIYFYDLIIPDIDGVYMVSATCSYKQSGVFVYSLDGTETEYPQKTTIYGTFQGNEIFLNDYEDWIYTQCTSQNIAGARRCDSYYDFNTSIHFNNLSNMNISSVELFFMGESSSSGAITKFYWWDWNTNAWVLLPNTLTYGLSSNVPIGVGEYVANLLPTTGIVNNDGIIRIRVETTHGSQFSVFYNWLNMKINTGYGIINDLKGGSELHVNKWFDQLEYDSSLIVNNSNQILNQTIKNYNMLLNINSTLNSFYSYVNNTFSPQVLAYLQDINTTITYMNGTLVDIDNSLVDINTTLYYINGELMTLEDYLLQVNSTITQVNSTVTDIYDIITQIDSLLLYINTTLSDFSTNTQNSLSYIESELLDIREEVDYSNTFSQEAIFLITDSIVAIKKAQSTTNNEDIISELKVVESNLQELKDGNNKGDSSLLSLFLAFIFFTLSIIGYKYINKEKKEQKEEFVSIPKKQLGG